MIDVGKKTIFSFFFKAGKNLFRHANNFFFARNLFPELIFDNFGIDSKNCEGHDLDWTWLQLPSARI